MVVSGEWKGSGRGRRSVGNERPTLERRRGAEGKHVRVGFGAFEVHG
jgi:hypothetical protein